MSDTARRPTRDVSPLPARVVDALRCPVCEAMLAPTSHALRCARGHSFDIARQGYVNLRQPRSPHGSMATADNAAMVRARAAFLAAGHYDRLVHRLAVIVRDLLDERAGRWGKEQAPPDDADPLIMDAGAGIGHHLAMMMEMVPRAVGIGVDVSKYAARRAARAHDRIGAVVCDVWGALPIQSGVADLVVNVFAPRHGAEFRRVLRDDGRLLVVTPTTRHLRDLVQVLGLLSVDVSKPDRLARALSGSFDVDVDEVVEYDLELSRAEVEQLVTMGPSGRHVDTAHLRAALDESPPRLRTTASFQVITYRPREPETDGCEDG